MTDEAIRQEPALAALDDTTLAVRDLIGASQDLTVRMARRMDMNVSDMRAIVLLTEHGPVGGAELARRLGISSAATTVLVDRLEHAGHVERVRDTVDRRRVTVTETPAARTAALHAWLPAIQEIDEVCRSLSESERAFARDLLGRLAAAMTRSGRS
jgi:DNA-binding MarR family transcriptional regulator